MNSNIENNNVENELKEMIIEKYGSLKAFTDRISMPWTTLDSIIKRGIGKANITNILKITNELGIDTENLAYGNIVLKNYDVSSSPDTTSPTIVQAPSSLSSLESDLLSLFSDLNSDGQDRVLDYASDLVASGKYKKTTAKQEA